MRISEQIDLRTLGKPRLPVRLLLVALTCLGLYFAHQSILSYAKIGSDFVQDYLAGLSVREGAPIYGESIRIKAEKELGIRGIHNFHPPPLALIFVPFSYLSLPSGYQLLVFGSLVLWWLVLSCAVKEMGYSLNLLWYVVPLSLIWYPILECIGLGQTSLVIASGVLGGWLLLRRGHLRSAGIVLGAVTLLKLFPGFLGVYFLISRKIIGGFYMALTFFVGMMLSVYVLGMSQVLEYFFKIAPLDIEVWSIFPANASLRGFLAPLILAEPWVHPFVNWSVWGKFIVEAFVFCVAVGSIWDASRVYNREKSVDGAFSLLTVGMLLVTPIGWTHNLPILAGALLVLAGRKRSTFPTLLVLVFFSLPTIDIIRELQNISGGPRIGTALFLLTRGATLGLLLLWYYLRSSREER